MKQYLTRGKRIRATDKDLVFHTATAALLPVFLLIVLLFHGRSIMQTDWQDVTLTQLGESIHISYLLISMGVAGLICLAAALVFRHYCRDYVKQLYHRQKLAKMVLEINGMKRNRCSQTVSSKTCPPAVQRRKSAIFLKSIIS